MVMRRAVTVLACLVSWALLAPQAIAEPGPDVPPGTEGSTDAPPAAAPGPPPDDGRVPSAPPSMTKTPDGWTLTVSSKDETMMPVPPLTTALSSRAYIVGGIFSGHLEGPGEPRGILEVGYQIGCGIDMSTSNGVTLTGSVGMTTSLGTTGPFLAPPTGFLPILSFPVSGGIAVALKPGYVNIVPVDKMEFKGNQPWVMISNFHVKVDGCVGQSFIRAFATMTRRTEQSDAILSWMGVTKAV
jgi:hypothetical protein